MVAHGHFNAALVAFLFLLPAVVLLLFAWFVWIGNKRPAISPWRLATFQRALILASLTYAMSVITGCHLLWTLEPARGAWLAANWLEMVTRLGAIAAAVAGRGSGRMLLLGWAVLNFVGVFAISLAMIP